MGRNPKQPKPLTKAGKISGYTLVNKLYRLVIASSEKDVRNLQKVGHRGYNAEWVRLVNILRLNEEKAKVIDGVRYSLGGIYSGKDTPHRSLESVLEMERFADLATHPGSTGRKCRECGERIGRNVSYKRLSDGKDAGPSLHMSHGIPAILGGANTTLNIMIECAYCNKARGMFISPEVRAWLKTIKFDNYK